MTQHEPPLNPERTQWSDDGTSWWDGSAWVPREDVPRRQAELEQEAALRLQREQAEYASRYAEWQQAQHQVAVEGNPFAPGAVTPPPPPPGMVMSPPPQAPVGPRPTGYATGMWSFVTALTCMSPAAIALGHVSRSQARKAHLKPNIWSRWGLALGYLQLGIGLVLAILLVAAAVNLYRSPLENSLENAATAEQIWHSAYGSYTPSMNDLAVTHFRPDPGVTVTVASASSDSFCLRAQKGDDVRWLRSGGSVSKDSCR